MPKLSSASAPHAALPFAFALAVLAAGGCGEQRESSPAERPAAAPERATSDAESTEEAGEHGSEHGGESGGDEHREGREHDGDGEHGEHAEGGEHGEEGEESGEYIGRTHTWDATRRGMRLTLSFDESRSAFTGTVENATEATICNVRVEVHLSSGVELGPTDGMDLAPGESAATVLPSDGESFERWTAHPESSRCGTG